MNTDIIIPNSAKLSGTAQSREMDRKTIEEFGIDGFTLMEIAASGAASGIRTAAGDRRKGLFVCGKGNNGGDALAAARYLCEDAGHSAAILFLMGDSDISPDAKKNLSLLRKLKKHGTDITLPGSLDTLTLSNFDYIVDGIFGTGITGAVREPVSGVIDRINGSGLPVFAMDVPSGLDADTGRVSGSAIRATHTFTFGTNKPGFWLNGAKEYTGVVHVVHLPFPNYLRETVASLINEELSGRLPDIKREASHKYDGGVVHILAGSEGLTGAAVMAAKSAWSSGAGAVHLYAPKKLLPVYEKNLPQIIKVAVGNDSDGFFKPHHAASIIEKMDTRPGVLLAGPGSGTQDETQECIFQVINHSAGTVILDADGLQGLSRLLELPEEKRRKWILTPHIGEAKKYLRMTFEDDYDRLTSAKAFVKEHKTSLLVKGNPTFFINSKREAFITGYDTLPFTRAGFGDVLAGTIAANSGITGEETLSALHALIKGYKKYQQFTDNGVFGPEHLL
jgi:ADP-dependent NAD(P)H-hydrate dehydratase / NAD(P)H-hydrate epimerase